MAISLGKHTARIEDDILFLELVGDLSIEEINSYVGLAAQIKAKHGHFFIIDDLARFGSAAPVVRKKVASWIGHSGCLGAALYGATLTSRTVALLVVGVMNMLGSRTLPIAFFKTEQEAYNWVGAQRRTHAT